MQSGTLFPFDGGRGLVGYVINYSGYLRNLIGYPCGNFFQHLIGQLSKGGSHCFATLHCPNSNYKAISSCVALNACGFSVGHNGEVLPEALSEVAFLDFFTDNFVGSFGDFDFFFCKKTNNANG